MFYLEYKNYDNYNLLEDNNPGYKRININKFLRDVFLVVIPAGMAYHSFLTDYFNNKDNEKLVRQKISDAKNEINNHTSNNEEDIKDKESANQVVKNVEDKFENFNSNVQMR